MVMVPHRRHLISMGPATAPSACRKRRAPHRHLMLITPQCPAATSPEGDRKPWPVARGLACRLTPAFGAPSAPPHSLDWHPQSTAMDLRSAHQLGAEFRSLPMQANFRPRPLVDGRRRRWPAAADLDRGDHRLQRDLQERVRRQLDALHRLVRPCDGEIGLASRGLRCDARPGAVVGHVIPRRSGQGGPPSWTAVRQLQRGPCQRASH